MSISDKAKASELKYSKQALIVLDQVKDDFDIDEFERFVKDNIFIIGGGYIIDYLTFKSAQKEKANKKPLCNPQKSA